MDPLTQGVITGVIANGLTAIVGQEAPELTSDEMFGAFCLIAAMLEASDDVKQLPRLIKKAQHPCFNGLRETLLARIGNKKTDQVQVELDQCGLNSRQQDLTRRWVDREINFVERKPLEG